MQFRFLLLTRFIVINTFLGALVLAAFGQGQASARGAVAAHEPRLLKTDRVERRVKDEVDEEDG